jgi:hypothetical protein
MVQPKANSMNAFIHPFIQEAIFNIIKAQNEERLEQEAF